MQFLVSSFYSKQVEIIALHSFLSVVLVLPTRLSKLAANFYKHEKRSKVMLAWKEFKSKEGYSPFK